MSNQAVVETGSTWLKHPEAVFTANDENADNGVIIKGSEIVELVPGGQAPSVSYDHVIDLSGKVLLPGLINTHHHFYQTLTRCVPSALNKPLFPWLQTLYEIWKHLDERLLATATELAVWELMQSGATTVGDHHYVFPQGLEYAVDIQAEVLGLIGCRGVLTRGSMSLGKSSGGLPPDSVIQSESVILDDCQRVINSFHQTGPGAKLQIALAPCSPFSVSGELMKSTAVMAKEHDVLMHTHLAETEDENQFCLSHYGMRPLDYLESCGWLNDRAWLAHGIYFDQEEIARLGAANVGIAHCPSSNMLLASGICPTLELESAGCRIGLAVDGSASNDCSNMIQEARQSLLQQRLRYGAERITAEKVLSWATRGSASVFHRLDLGQISVGMQADFAVFDLEELRFSGAGSALDAIVVCGASQVDQLYVGGRRIIESRDHCAEKNRELIGRHKTLAKELQKKQ